MLIGQAWDISRSTLMLQVGVHAVLLLVWFGLRGWPYLQRGTWPQRFKLLDWITGLIFCFELCFLLAETSAIWGFWVVPVYKFLLLFDPKYNGQWYLCLEGFLVVFVLLCVILKIVWNKVVSLLYSGSHAGIKTTSQVPTATTTINVTTPSTDFQLISQLLQLLQTRVASQEPNMNHISLNSNTSDQLQPIATASTSIHAISASKQSSNPEASHLAEKCPTEESREQKLNFLTQLRRLLNFEEYSDTTSENEDTAMVAVQRGKPGRPRKPLSQNPKQNQRNVQFQPNEEQYSEEMLQLLRGRSEAQLRSELNRRAREQRLRNQRPEYLTEEEKIMGMKSADELNRLWRRQGGYDIKANDHLPLGPLSAEAVAMPRREVVRLLRQRWFTQVAAKAATEGRPITRCEACGAIFRTNKEHHCFKSGWTTHQNQSGIPVDREIIVGQTGRQALRIYQKPRIDPKKVQEHIAEERGLNRC